MSDSLVAQPFVASTPMVLNIRKLTRAQMEELLIACFHEQRAPMINELHIPTPKKSRITYTTERTGTGLFDSLDDDTLAKVLLSLPIKMRIVFAKSLCKQFASVAHEHKVFKSIYISPCGGHYGETKEETNNMLRTVGNWRFLTTGSADAQIEELKLHEGSGRTVDMPPTNHLQGLTKLTLSQCNAPTVKLIRKSIEASKLKELTLSCVKGINDTIALLKASTNLERLVLCGLPDFDMSKIVDEWRKVHNGFPPLRFLSTDSFGRKVMMHELEKLDLDEMRCSMSQSIGKGHLPSLRNLSVHIYNCTATQDIPLLKTLVASCPGLLKLTLTRTILAEMKIHGVTVVADAMKTEFPRLNIEVCVE